MEKMCNIAVKYWKISYSSQLPVALIDETCNKSVSRDTSFKYEKKGENKNN